SVGPPVAVPEPIGFPTRAHPTLQAPSLEDVTKQYMLNLHSGEVPAPVPVDVPCLPLAAPPSAEAKPPEAARPPDEPTPASKCCSKPQVDMRKHVAMTLLDTEQSYVESLRTLMQVGLGAHSPENGLSEPRRLSDGCEQTPFMDKGLRPESRVAGTRRLSMKNPQRGHPREGGSLLLSKRECRGARPPQGRRP
ncbi:ARHGEF17 isoform 6, partial [Pongo abelii]